MKVIVKRNISRTTVMWLKYPLTSQLTTVNSLGYPSYFQEFISLHCVGGGWTDGVWEWCLLKDGIILHPQSRVNSYLQNEVSQDKGQPGKPLSYTVLWWLILVVNTLGRENLSVSMAGRHCSGLTWEGSAHCEWCWLWTAGPGPCKDDWPKSLGRGQ